jgi:DNA-binding transcriptional ArsR family regulator
MTGLFNRRHAMETQEHELARTSRGFAASLPRTRWRPTTHADGQSPVRALDSVVVHDDTCELLCLDLPRAEALRHSRPAPADLEAAAVAAKALADPTRLAVAVALRDGGELCVCDLAWVCERSDKLVSHHARALRAAALVRSRRDGKMVLYSLTDAGAALLAAVMLATGEAPA